ncbi:DUF4065 domain-containing protein [Haloferax sp. AS1]|uniref:type II toxin-antitoxin system antitoxin SocA domain-containing protein n=1 Tax=Haloferax TaxID=2251 RepID=UPI00165FA710|nr:type II toxin-antitoxin system antitoxin SocA domain-containing protein [Haloferax sp. AS1]MBC9988405.1 DUF4065 domain-containing protein [Haloferax sp. AS1]
MAKIDEINEETDLAFLLFNYADEVEGITRLQKLLFLLQEETEFKDVYENVEIEFKPYKYGPFSEQIYDELELLISMGAIREVEAERADHLRDENDTRGHSNKRFVLTDRGRTIAKEVNRQLEDDLEGQFAEVISEHVDMDLEDLLRYVYQQYEEYTTESEIKDEIMGQ